MGGAGVSAPWTVLAILTISAWCSSLLTLACIALAPSLGLIDQPNSRSSHEVVTARGGGLAIVIVVGTALVWLTGPTSSLVLAILPGLLAIAAVGLIDDLRGLPALLRLLVHALAVYWFLSAIGGTGRFGLSWLDAHEIVGNLIVALGMVWFINAFNFMDGIDGIAGSQGAFIAGGVLVCVVTGGFDAEFAYISAAICGACVGFLILNWSPARIFMGDVGSGALGFALAALCALSWKSGSLSAWAALLLTAAIHVDATVTLITRIFRGELWYAPHRSHAYQRLARRLGSHAWATSLFMAVSAFVLLPAAVVVNAGYVTSEAIFALGILGTLALAVTIVGAGRPD